MQVPIFDYCPTSNLLHIQINKIFYMISYFHLVLAPPTPCAMIATLTIQPNIHYI
jgi:hypothetical protein